MSQENKRCVRCVLPASIPGSDFDDTGQCYWCRAGFPNASYLGETLLKHKLNSLRRPGGEADCLVGVSGGKDSVYTLLYLKEKLGMRVEAFTYTYQGFRSFALANARKACARLQIPHHIIQLPNQQHRELFAKFFSVWLAKPDPLTAAIACVGCKHMHVLGARLAQGRGIPMMVWGISPLEHPPFTITQQSHTRQQTHRASSGLGLTLLSSIVGQADFRRAFFSQPRTCTVGCLAFRPGTGYMRTRYPSVSQISLFDYVTYDPAAIKSYIQHAAGWTLPRSVPHDWHSDCAYSVLKEYMYQTMFGASYIDAHLSNLVRYKLLDREDAWRQLVAIKRHHKAILPHTLEELELSQHAPSIDASCFDISAESHTTGCSAPLPALSQAAGATCS